MCCVFMGNFLLASCCGKKLWSLFLSSSNWGVSGDDVICGVSTETTSSKKKLPPNHAITFK